MKVGMVVDNPFWGDSRLEKEVDALIDHGIEVIVLCVNHERDAIQDYKGVKIISKYWNKFLFKKINGLNNTFLNIYPKIWARWISEFIESEGITHLHVHDLWMLEAGLKSGKEKGVKIISDLHENFVFALGNYRYSTTFPGKYIISQDKWARCEKKWLQEVDHIIVVIEEAKERIINLGLPSSIISVVPNYVSKGRYGKMDLEFLNELKKRFQEKKTLTYTGVFDLHRGLEVVVKSVKHVLAKIPDFHLVLVGDGANKKDLEILAQKEGVLNKISFEGYRPSTELSAYVSASDVCIIPHLKTQHTDKTIPHKLFQYMLMKKPVVSTNCKPLERIVKDAQCGYIYQYDDPKQCAQAVIRAFCPEAQQLAQNGLHAVEHKYNWNKAAEELLKVYR